MAPGIGIQCLMTSSKCIEKGRHSKKIRNSQPNNLFSSADWKTGRSV